MTELTRHGAVHVLQTRGDEIAASLRSVLGLFARMLALAHAIAQGAFGQRPEDAHCAEARLVAETLRVRGPEAPPR